MELLTLKDVKDWCDEKSCAQCAFGQEDQNSYTDCLIMVYTVEEITKIVKEVKNDTNDCKSIVYD